MEEQLNLLDFGYNEDGLYTNLVEEEAIKNDIKEQEYQKWLKEHDNPIIRLVEFAFGDDETETNTYNQLKSRFEAIADTKCYHYGNMEKGLYIFSLCDKQTSREILVFENENHYLLFTNFGFKFDETTKEVVDYTLDDVLSGKATISFPALFCPCFDLDGNKIEDYYDGTDYQKDIRHIVCIKEWQMDKFSKNRIQENKRIKDFYEVEFRFQDLVAYWG